MKSLEQFVIEKLKIRKGKQKYNYTPRTKKELRELIDERVATEGPNVNLNDIDVSNISDFSRVFRNVRGKFDKFNGDVSEWDVSNAEQMAEMFYECQNFNCDLSKWDVSNVHSMALMFAGCESFEGKGLENWNTENVENMYAMFSGCYNFNSDISGWDVSNVHNFGEMFDSCSRFNQDLNNWNVKPNATFGNTFDDCKALKKLPQWYK